MAFFGGPFLQNPQGVFGMLGNPDMQPYMDALQQMPFGNDMISGGPYMGKPFGGGQPAIDPAVIATMMGNTNLFTPEQLAMAGIQGGGAAPLAPRGELPGGSPPPGMVEAIRSSGGGVQGSPRGMKMPPSMGMGMPNQAPMPYGNDGRARQIPPRGRGYGNDGRPRQVNRPPMPYGNDGRPRQLPAEMVGAPRLPAAPVQQPMPQQPMAPQQRQFRPGGGPQGSTSFSQMRGGVRRPPTRGQY